MAGSTPRPPSSGRQFQTAIAALAPYIDGDEIAWNDFDRVVTGLGTNHSARVQLEEAIAAAGLSLRDKPEAEQPKKAPHAASTETSDARAISAARAVIAADRQRRNHSKIILKAHEEVGLALLMRGEAGVALPQGGFGQLQDEAREAAECLFLHNQGLIHSVAQRYAPSGMEYDDLIQHGSIGLIRAVELFDPRQGNKFSTYAMNWVQQAITRGIANEARLIRIPVHMWEKVNKVWAIRSALSTTESPSSVRDLVRESGLNEKEVLTCLRLGPQHVTSLDRIVGDDAETTLGDLLALQPDSEPTAFEIVVHSLLKEEIAAVLDTLSEREAGVISMRHGLDDDAPKTLDQIGKVYRLTRERIRQIESKTLSKLRHPFRSGGLRDYL